MSYKIIENVLPLDFCEKTANYASQSNQWIDAGRDAIPEEQNAEHSTFPIMPVVKNGEFTQNHPFAGWFLAMGSLLCFQALSKLGYSEIGINPQIQRVHLVAHRPGESGIVVPHRDLTEEYCSIVWQIAEFHWQKDWGGSTFIDGEEVEFMTNRAVFFPSNLLHYGTPPNDDCPHVRMVLNVVFRPPESLKWQLFKAGELDD